MQLIELADKIYIQHVIATYPPGLKHDVFLDYFPVL